MGSRVRDHMPLRKCHFVGKVNEGGRRSEGSLEPTLIHGHAPCLSHKFELPCVDICGSTNINAWEHKYQKMVLPGAHERLVLHLLLSPCSSPTSPLSPPSPAPSIEAALPISSSAFALELFLSALPHSHLYTSFNQRLDLVLNINIKPYLNLSSL